MDACRRVMTVLIVLLWTLGGIPTSRCDSMCDHTGGGDGVDVLVYRRPEAALGLPDAGTDAASLPPRASVAAGAAVSCSPSPSATIERVVASASIVGPGSPRGPPSLA